MTDDQISRLRELVKEWESKSPYNLVGCPESEIDEIMRKQAVKWLPPVYVEFMSLLGRESGHIESRTGDVFRYPYVTDFKVEAIPLLVKQLSDDSFVFWTNYEDVIFFHTVPRIDDPVVYHMTSSENDIHIPEITECGILSEFLLDVIQSSLDLCT